MIEIVGIKEGGSNNILKWGLSKGVDLTKYDELVYLANTDMFFLIQLNGVNQFELFQLAKHYRNKIRTLEWHPASAPSEEDLKAMFPGTVKYNEKEVEAYTLASRVIENWMNLTAQMMSDNDIITGAIASRFLPMIAVTHRIQIPISLLDLYSSMSKDEVRRAFVKEYHPISLDQFPANEISGVRMRILSEFVKQTNVEFYSDTYEKLHQFVRYSFLNSYNAPTNYKIGLVDFFKYDPVDRSEVRCSLFKSNKDELREKMKLLQRISSPLQFRFAVQAPIDILTTLMVGNRGKDISITDISTISEIMGRDQLNMSNFKTIEVDDEEQKIEFEQRIENYRMRITEADVVMRGVISTMASEWESISPTSIYSLLPSMYTARAIITVTEDVCEEIAENSAIDFKELFMDITHICNQTKQEIQRIR